MNRVSIWFGVMGILLMPFSTDPEDGLVVVAFGLPFILMAVILRAGSLSAVFKVMPNAQGLLEVAFLLCLIVFLTATFAPAPMASMSRAAVFLLGYFFAVWIMDVCRDREAFKILAKSFFLGGCVLSAYYILNFAYKGVLLGFDLAILERYVGGVSALPWGASNVIGGVILLVLIAFFAFRKSMDNSWGWLVFLLCSLAIVLTFSRAAIVLALAGFILLMLPTLSKANFQATIIGSLILLIGLMVGLSWLLATAPEAFEELLDSRFDADNLTGGGGRMDIWIERIRDIPDALLVPNGYYSSLYVYDSVTPHNYWITVALEQGIWGFAVTIVFWGLLFRTFGALPHSRGASVAGTKYRIIWAIVLAHMFVEDLIFIQPYVIYFWTLFGLTVVHHQYLMDVRSIPIKVPKLGEKALT